jgi:hypothetical protein
LRVVRNDRKLRFGHASVLKWASLIPDKTVGAVVSICVGRLIKVQWIEGAKDRAWPSDVCGRE